jgi:FkbM family methyltransferase
MLISKFIRFFPPEVRESLIHVGAHYGYEAKSYEEHGFKSVLWVEGDPGIFPLLQQHLSQFNKTQHTAINALVTASSNQSRKFYRFSNEGASSSIYLPTQTFNDIFCEVEYTGESLDLESISLDDLVTQNNIRPSALVVDVQGAELEVLSGGKQALQSTRIIDIEVSKQEFYDGGTLFNDLDTFIRELGFVRLTFVPWHGDVIYFKPQGISAVQYFMLRLVAIQYNFGEYFAKLHRLVTDSITRPSYIIRKFRIRFGSSSKEESISPS